MTELSEGSYIEDGRAWLPVLGGCWIYEDPNKGILYAPLTVYSEVECVIVLNEPYRGFYSKRNGQTPKVERLFDANKEHCIRILNMSLDVELRPLPGWVELVDDEDAMLEPGTS